MRAGGRHQVIGRLLGLAWPAPSRKPWLRRVTPSRPAQSPAGSWRAVLDLAGGPLQVRDADLGIRPASWRGEMCNGSSCLPFSGIQRRG